MKVSFEWVWQAKASPGRLWPFVSDTNRINRAVGLKPWFFDTRPAPQGGSVRSGRTRAFGQTVTWDELPYEWRAPAEMGVERHYHSGPYERIISTVRLAPDGGGTRLTHRIDIVCRGLFGWIAARVHLGWATRRAFDRVYRHLFEVTERPQLEPFPEPSPALPPSVVERLETAASRLSEHHPREIVVQFMRHLREAPELRLQRIRPFVLAREWEADRMEVLRLCLRATRLGILQMSWRVLCPHCRGAMGTNELDELTSASHCESCNIDFEAEFTRHVEVVFMPSEQIRKLDAVDYCVGGPGSTPHVVLQRRLPPGADESLTLALPPGSYRLRSPQIDGSLRLAVEAEGPAELSFAGGEGDRDAAVRSGGAVHVRNGTDTEALFMVERREWEEDAATADVVTSCQDFRDLFADEVIARGEQFKVALLAFLFTDLRGSTAMYERVGDVPAFAFVRVHFALLEAAVRENRGAVVKTIGDAVMAVFMDPADAVRAARRMQESLRGKERDGETLVLRVGVHAGPCVAVNMNDRLDYFGTTVNVAARLQGQSEGGDVVITEALAGDPAVRRVLEATGPRVEPFRAKLKGLRDEAVLHRVWFFE